MSKEKEDIRRLIEATSSLGEQLKVAVRKLEGKGIADMRLIIINI